jgi:hypothetical protein
MGLVPRWPKSSRCWSASSRIWTRSSIAGWVVTSLYVVVDFLLLQSEEIGQLLKAMLTKEIHEVEEFYKELAKTFVARHDLIVSRMKR